MAKENKSILEEALLDVKRIQEALNANTREILRSVSKEEIDGVLKESLNEEDFEEEDAEETDLVPVETGDDESGEPEVGDTEETGLDSIETGDDESGENFEDAIGDQEIGDETSMDMGMSDMGDEIDMTAASDEDVIAVYKKLTGNDEIEIVGDDIHLTVSEPGEYVIKTKGNGGPTEMGSDLGSELDSELDLDDSTEDDVTYDIEMGDETGDEDESGEELDLGSDEPSEEDLVPVDTEDDEENIEEAKYVGGKVKYVAGSKTNAKLQESYTKQTITEATTKYNKLLVESAQLKKENEEFRTSLKKFRNMLVETVVFNSNLTYVTKLFMEHSTTKDEKKEILRKFDEEVTSLKESKKLYKTIANDLTSRKPLSESIEKKINTEILSSTSKLNESVAYVDKDTQRIKDLINRVENKNN